jgi:hypothetical protein
MISDMPALHSSMLTRILAVLRGDIRFEAVLGGGSLIHGGFDAHSDLDLVLLVRPDAYAEVMAQRQAIAGRADGLLAAFTGEHVGESRLLICLYGPPLIHVDLKFVEPAALSEMVERPVVLWARDEAVLLARLDAAMIRWPDREPQWFEDRAWIWLHYASTKLLRGEWFEAIGMLAYFRENVLGPLLHRRAARPQRGVRRIECDAHARRELVELVAGYDAVEIRQALDRCIDLYMALRRDDPPLQPVAQMPDALRALLATAPA